MLDLSETPVGDVDGAEWEELELEASDRLGRKAIEKGETLVKEAYERIFASVTMEHQLTPRAQKILEERGFEIRDIIEAVKSELSADQWASMETDDYTFANFLRIVRERALPREERNVQNEVIRYLLEWRFPFLFRKWGYRYQFGR